MKKILLATDLSVNSDRAMEKAIKLSKEQNASLHILHVLPDYREKMLTAPLKQNMHDKIKQFLDDYQDSTGLDIKIDVTEDGSADFQILEYADKIEADLIIMGLHGKSKFRDLFIGTTIERVVRKGTKPVLVVKNKPVTSYSSIISAIDFAPASREALRLALGLFPDANFEILHTYFIAQAYPTTVQYALQMSDAIEKAQHKAMIAFIHTEQAHYEENTGNTKKLTYTLSEGSPYQELIKKVEESKADLITIGAHGKSMITPSKLGGIAEDILSNPPCDVLVIKE